MELYKYSGLEELQTSESIIINGGVIELPNPKDLFYNIGRGLRDAYNAVEAFVVGFYDGWKSESNS